jgi:hypothetical protein
LRRRIVAAVAAVVSLAALGVGGFALAQTTEETTEEHVLTFVTTFTDVDPAAGTVTETLPGGTVTETTPGGTVTETVTETVTGPTTTVVVTETVTVTTPTGGTTTEPEPEPDPRVCTRSNRDEWGPTYEPGECLVRTIIELGDQQFTCNRPLSDYGDLPILVRFEYESGVNRGGDRGALDILGGCRGDSSENTIDLFVESNANGFTLGVCGGGGKFRTGPTNIQVSGNFNAGPRPSLVPGCSAAHQDGWQFQTGGPNDNLDIINGQIGDWDAGTAGAIGAGGAIFYSAVMDVDVYGGRYVTCNHGLFGNLSALNEIVDVQFRAGRIDGTDPRCTGINSPANEAPCPRPSELNGATLTNVTCQRWSSSTDTWETQPGYGR